MIDKKLREKVVVLNKMKTSIYVILFFAILIGLIISIAVYNDASSSSVIIPHNDVVLLCSTCSIVTPGATPQSASGIKRALLIGCNYNYSGSPAINMGATLSGCINDIHNIRTHLISKGYSNSNIMVMCDDGSASFPAKSLILSTLNSMMRSMQTGDVSFVWYSGHGTQLQNVSADNGNNECWCPPDTLSNRNYLTDSELHDALRLAPSDSTVFVGSDACHSATVLDLQYILIDPSGANQNKHLNTLRGKAPSVCTTSFNSKTVFTPILPISRTTGSMNLVYDSFYSPISALVIGLSGCQDYDTSADTVENNQAQGAMTWSFLGSLPTTCLSDLVLTMRKSLHDNNYSQIPQLTLSRPIDPNSTSLSFLLGI
jgi:hypothetical protein